MVRYGTAEQCRRRLERLLAGEIRSAFAISDVASSEATNIETRIRRRRRLCYQRPQMVDLGTARSALQDPDRDGPAGPPQPGPLPAGSR
jgi:hypothetical protein